MIEYIERDKALNASKIVYIEYIELDYDGYEEADADNIPVVLKKDIEAIPAADVKPVVRGKWEEDRVDKWRCSCCKVGNNYAYSYNVRNGYVLQDNYCPNCGADMKTANEESVNNEA